MVKERADQGGSLGFNVSKRQRQKQSGNGGKIPDKSSASKKREFLEKVTSIQKLLPAGSQLEFLLFLEFPRCHHPPEWWQDHKAGSPGQSLEIIAWPWKVVQWWWEGGRQRGCQDWSWSRCQPWSPTLNICIIGKETHFQLDIYNILYLKEHAKVPKWSLSQQRTWCSNWRFIIIPNNNRI